jgi:hypothetical protein
MLGLEGLLGPREVRTGRATELGYRSDSGHKISIGKIDDDTLSWNDGPTGGRVKGNK